MGLERLGERFPGWWNGVGVEEKDVDEWSLDVDDGPEVCCCWFVLVEGVGAWTRQASEVPVLADLVFKLDCDRPWSCRTCFSWRVWLVGLRMLLAQTDQKITIATAANGSRLLDGFHFCGISGICCRRSVVGARVCCWVGSPQ